MKKWVFASVAIFVLSWAFWPRVHSTTAMPEAGLEVTFYIWPMQSIQSDWYRMVSIEYHGERIEMNLFEDTGWWRGSNLYVHHSGVYVVHEGQNGCFAFTAKPTEFVDVPQGACTKLSSLERDLDQGSRYYRGLTYLGHFQETYRDADGVRLRFLDSSRISEVELPEML